MDEAMLFCFGLVGICLLGCVCGFARFSKFVYCGV